MRLVAALALLAACGSDAPVEVDARTVDADLGTFTHRYALAPNDTAAPLVLLNAGTTMTVRFTATLPVTWTLGDAAVASGDGTITADAAGAYDLTWHNENIARAVVDVTVTFDGVGEIHF